MDCAVEKTDTVDDDILEVTDAPPMKKFKQVCLQFKPMDVKVKVKSASNTNKKRKLSDQESPSAKAPKTIKPIVQENFKTPVLENDPEVSSSSEADSLQVNSLQKNKTTRSNILEKFIRKSSQEEITSTIDVIDIAKTETKTSSSTGDLASRKTAGKVSPKQKTLNSMFIQKTSTPNSKVIGNRKSFDPKVEKENAHSAESESKSVKCDVVEVSDEDQSSQNDGDCSSDEDNTSLNKSSLDESKMDLSLMSTPGKSSTGLDSSVSEAAINADSKSGSVPASDASTTPATKKPRSSSKMSDKKKQERSEMRMRIKEQKEKERMEKKLQKEKESQEKKQKLEAMKLEKERLKKEEKEQKEREKQEKIEKLEKEKLEKLQLKEEEKKKKQEMLDAKMEEKKKKEDEKKMKEEEKKMKEEEKKKEEEEKLKKQNKVKQAFEGFFVKQNTCAPKPAEVIKTDLCKYFEVKKDTYRAPRVWRILNSTEKSNLDKVVQSQESSPLYIDSIKCKSHQPLHADPDQYRHKKDNEEEIIIHDTETVKKMTHHVKYIFFHTNYRPPYYGTWRKKSDKLTPRNPFKMDSDLLDYEVDSDDEWEEEEPGESLSASEGEDGDDKEKEDEEEGDDGWMVPHGYLSEDEGCDDDKEITPEVLKARQQAKADQWEADLKRQCQPVKTIVIGCYWEEEENQLSRADLDILESFSAVCLSTAPVDTTLSIDKTKSTTMTPGTERCATPSGSKGTKPKSVPEEAMPELIKLLHGNTSGIKKLIHEFRVYWKQKTGELNNVNGDSTVKTETSMEVEEEDSPKRTNLNESLKEENTPAKEDQFSISKRQLELKITSVAVREKRSAYKKICWHVHDSILKQYNLDDLSYPNTWEYVTVTKVKREDNNTVDVATPSTATNSTEADLNTSVCDENQTPVKVLPKDQRSIMDFTKKLAHPPEIVAKPVEVINGAKINPETKTVVKPNVLKLLNAAAKQSVTVSTSDDKITPITSEPTVKAPELVPVVERMEINEDSNGCILLD
ncbi:hypothetical protein SNE40_004544 [Patella caerulea]|uniref:Chromatin assembly factor 1 subunit A n=1 Tax=Patella caerulea TaxID=87958 RepID=A0AAN8K4Y4_PATCE